MEIVLCKIDVFDYKKCKEILLNKKSDMVIFTVDFSQSKEQIFYLLFFDEIIKASKKFVLIIDIDFEKCLLKNIFAFDGKSYKRVSQDFQIGGFVIRLNGKRLPFVVGDNIYKKRYRDFIGKYNFDVVFHIDIYGEGVIAGGNFFDKKIKIISTKNDGEYKLKK